MATQDALPEIYASGSATPSASPGIAQTGNMFVADIGQNIVEELALVTTGANLGWNDWEGSYRFVSRQAVSPRAARRSGGDVSAGRIRARSIRCCCPTPPRAA